MCVPFQWVLAAGTACILGRQQQPTSAQAPAARYTDGSATTAGGTGTRRGL